MQSAFDQIAQIEGLLAAAFIDNDHQLQGWTATTAIAQEKLHHAAVTIADMLDGLAQAQQDVYAGSTAFGEHAFVFRRYPGGLIIAYLDSPVNDAVLEWLWMQVTPILETAGVAVG